jgi:hypothetical protein
VHAKTARGESSAGGSNNNNIASKRAALAFTATSASRENYLDELLPAGAEESLGTF